MAEFYSPTYLLDLRDRSNCLRIENVTVHDPTAKPILAKGMLSQDSASFYGVITRADGAQQSYPLIYQRLMKALSY